MLTFLFWNLYKRDLRASIARLAVRHEVDVLIFAECEIPPVSLLQTLNPIDQVPQFYYVPNITSGKIQIFTRFDSSLIHPLSDGSRYTIRRLNLPERPELLLAAAHLLSPLHSGDYVREAGTRAFAEDIQRVEGEQGHDRTILVGDLNQNPFDDGIVAANALHAVISKQVARLPIVFRINL